MPHLIIRKFHIMRNAAQVDIGDLPNGPAFLGARFVDGLNCLPQGVSCPAERSGVFRGIPA